MLGRKERRTSYSDRNIIHLDARGREDELPYSDLTNIDLGGRAEGKANSRILIETSSISTLGRREKRTAVV